MGTGAKEGEEKREEERKKYKKQDGPDGLLNTHAGLGKSWREDFKRRKGLAWCVIRKYNQVWRAKASMDSKHKLFQALVEPVLCYGAFTYPDLAEVTPLSYTAPMPGCCATASVWGGPTLRGGTTGRPSGSTTASARTLARRCVLPS
jgi:hypothetical protein